MKKIFSDERNIHIFLLSLLVLIAIWSSIRPFSFIIWLSNIFVALIYVLGFALTYKKFRFTTFSYVLIFIHIFIILVAAKYTYENTPLFNVIRDWIGADRNNFDRLGHFLQGFIPIILVRELFIRRNYMKKSPMFYVTILFFVMGISGLWEISEFVGATVFGETEAYEISAQGDIWDAQWDMVLCGIGACISLLVLSKSHDKAIEKVDG